MSPMICIEGLAKGFTLHLQGGIGFQVLREAALTVLPGECVALTGPSGAGKSTLMRCLQGNYGSDAGHIWLRHRDAEVDFAAADPRLIREIRRETLGWLPAIPLRVIPRVSARDVVAEPLIARGMAPAEAEARHLPAQPAQSATAPAWFAAGHLLGWRAAARISPAAAPEYPILLLDEPTASLDAGNREVVVGLISEAKALAPPSSEFFMTARCGTAWRIVPMRFSLEEAA